MKNSYSSLYYGISFLCIEEIFLPITVIPFKYKYLMLFELDQLNLKTFGKLVRYYCYPFSY